MVKWQIAVYNQKRNKIYICMEVNILYWYQISFNSKTNAE